jgi:hypothetical protein
MTHKAPANKPMNLTVAFGARRLSARRSAAERIFKLHRRYVLSPKTA